MRRRKKDTPDDAELARQSMEAALADGKNSPAPDAPDRIVEVTVTLPVQLTDAELVEVARQQAAAHQELNRLEVAKSSQAKQIAAQIQEQEAKLNALAQKVSSGFEYRNVPCQRVTDYRRGEVRIYRTDLPDAWTLVSVRALTSQERQTALPLDDGMTHAGDVVQTVLPGGRWENIEVRDEAAPDKPTPPGCEKCGGSGWLQVVEEETGRRLGVTECLVCNPEGQGDKPHRCGICGGAGEVMPESGEASDGPVKCEHCGGNGTEPEISEEDVMLVCGGDPDEATPPDEPEPRRTPDGLDV